MDRPKDYQTNWSKSKRQIWYHLYVESKIWHQWIYLWNRLTDTENRLMASKGEKGEGWMNLEFGISKHKLLCIDWINNYIQVLLYSTGTIFKILWQTIMEKKCEKEYIGTSLVVHWLRLHAPKAGHLGSIPGQGTRSHMMQLKIPHAATKSWHSQTDKHFLKRIYIHISESFYYMAEITTTLKINHTSVKYIF